MVEQAAYLNVLALDVSSVSTGWAHLVYKYKVPSAKTKGGKASKIMVKNYGVIHPTGKNASGRLILFESMLKIIIHQLEPDVIVVEDLNHMRNMNVVKTLGAFLGDAKKLAYEFTHADPVSLKRTAILKKVLDDGGASKLDVIQFVNKNLLKKKKLSIEAKESEDIADAIVAGYCYLLEVEEKDGQEKR